MKMGDIIITNTDVEVTPLHVVPKAMLGVIIDDETVPNYFLVKFANYDVQWIDGKYLTVIKTNVQ